MSVAYELDLQGVDVSYVDLSSTDLIVSPVSPMPGGRPRRLTVVPVSAEHPRPATRVLAPPAPAVLRPLDDPSPLRLTRRGVVVLAAAVALLGAALVAIAASYAPTAPGTVPIGPPTVTVHAGDTLWSIASHVAPNSDPAAEVASLQRLNHLHGAALTPGEQLRVR